MKQHLRLIICAAAIGAAGTVLATTVPATAYAQDGLVVQYDGLESAGAGVHDAGITAWKDLTGNGHDLALNANDTVGADCVNIAKASRTRAAARPQLGGRNSDGPITLDRLPRRARPGRPPAPGGPRL